MAKVQRTTRAAAPKANAAAAVQAPVTNAAGQGGAQANVQVIRLVQPQPPAAVKGYRGARGHAYQQLLALCGTQGACTVPYWQANFVAPVKANNANAWGAATAATHWLGWFASTGAQGAGCVTVQWVPASTIAPGTVNGA